MFATQVSHKEETMKHTMGQHKKGMALVGVIAMAMFVMMTGVAFAEVSPTSAALPGGPLTLSGPLEAGTFSKTLDGAADILNGVGFTGFSVTDPRGTGVGWSVSMQAAIFDNADKPG